MIGTDSRESAFRDDLYVDDVIKLKIAGDTAQEINEAAADQGLTAAQWLRVAITAALEFRAVERKPDRCVDPDCQVCGS